jgi:hypothetical protein
MNKTQSHYHSDRDLENKELNADECRKSEMMWWKNIQACSFAEELHSLRKILMV